jgi:hypothetical protein
MNLNTVTPKKFYKIRNRFEAFISGWEEGNQWEKQHEKHLDPVPLKPIHEYIRWYVYIYACRTKNVKVFWVHVSWDWRQLFASVLRTGGRVWEANVYANRNVSGSGGVESQLASMLSPPPRGYEAAIAWESLLKPPLFNPWSCIYCTIESQCSTWVHAVGGGNQTSPHINSLTTIYYCVHILCVSKCLKTSFYPLPSLYLLVCPCFLSICPLLQWGSIFSIEFFSAAQSLIQFKVKQYVAMVPREKWHIIENYTVQLTACTLGCSDFHIFSQSY